MMEQLNRLFFCIKGKFSSWRTLALKMPAVSGHNKIDGG